MEYPYGEQNFSEYSSNSNAIYYLIFGITMVLVIFLFIKLYLDSKYVSNMDQDSKNDSKPDNIKVDCPKCPDLQCPEVKCPVCPKCPKCKCPSIKEVINSVMPGRNPDNTANDFFPLNPYNVAAPLTEGTAELDMPVNTIDSIYIIQQQNKKMNEIKDGIKRLQDEYEQGYNDGYNITATTPSNTTPSNTTPSNTTPSNTTPGVTGGGDSGGGVPV